MTARSSIASSDAMFDSFLINFTNQNLADSDSFRFDFEISLDVETFFCNDIDLDKANHHILNRYVTYRVLIHLYDDDTIQVSILYMKFTVE